MAGSPTAAWSPKRPEQAPAEVRGPRFASVERPTTSRATRPFRWGSEDRPDPDAPLGVGSVIGDRYRIRGLLGEGGMGRVYEAEHIVLRRRVALKLLRRDAAAEAENLARFQQEALAASRIGAPEIVEVVDFASQLVAGRPQTYMVMELLVGENLEDWMDRSGRLDHGLELLATLCDGLAAAHRAAVVHRDIKPANVFLPARDPTHAAQARVKILDFGIAKITAGGEGFQTRQGSLLGTPYYLAPERVMGATLTGAADIYSVGVILYEMLTGNVPFVANSFMGILANHVHTPALDPRQAAPDRQIPAAVAQLCLRLLSKDPSDRPTAEGVAAQLRSLLDDDAEALANVEIGPRASTTLGADTQVFSDATHELASYAPAASSIAIEEPVLGAEPSGLGSRGARRVGIGVGVGVVAVGLVVSLAVGLGFGTGGASTTEPRGADASEANPGDADGGEPDAGGPSAALADSTPATVRTSGVEPAPTPDESTLTVPDLEPEPEPEPKPEPEPSREVRDGPAGSPSQATPKPRPQPKPEPEPEPEPAAKPSVDPPQPDPPAPKPEPDPTLPTITDDVYD